MSYANEECEIIPQIEHVEATLNEDAKEDSKVDWGAEVITHIQFVDDSIPLTSTRFGGNCYIEKNSKMFSINFWSRSIYRRAT